MVAPTAAPFAVRTPESEGISSRVLLDFVDAVDSGVSHLHSLILLRRGNLVAEGYWSPFRADLPHVLFSLSKSFTSTAIGFLVAEGRVSVDDRVLSLLPGPVPPAGSHLDRLRLRDLLTMTSGHETDPTRVMWASALPWVDAFFAEPLAREPGTHFVYNSGATYLCSAIVQRITGMRLVDYLTPRLFAPLGIAGATWEQSPQGIDTGGWGLKLTTRDIAKFGLLYQRDGRANGARLLPEAWIEEATAARVTNAPAPNPDWEQGYGYQFWRCRHGAYRGDGAFGQYCIVFPRQEAVLAITAGTQDMQGVLDLVWRHLLPAFGDAALPEAPGEASRLAERLAGLALPTVAGAATSPSAAHHGGRRYAVDENAEGIEAVSFQFNADGTTLRIENRYGAQEIPFGFGAWTEGRATLDRVRIGRVAASPDRIAGSGAWADDQTFVGRIWWNETPFSRTFTCHFEADSLRIAQQENVGFEGTERPTLTGVALPA